MIITNGRDGTGEVGGGRGEGGGEGGGGGDGTATTGIRDDDDGEMGRQRGGRGDGGGRERGWGSWVRAYYYLRISHHCFIFSVQITRPYIFIYLVESFSLSRWGSVQLSGRVMTI